MSKSRKILEWVLVVVVASAFTVTLILASVTFGVLFLNGSR